MSCFQLGALERQFGVEKQLQRFFVWRTILPEGIIPHNLRTETILDISVGVILNFWLLEAVGSQIASTYIFEYHVRLKNGKNQHRRPVPLLA